MTIDMACGHPTKKGTPCATSRHSWMVGFDFEYADGCWRHMDPSFREAMERRKQQREEEWQEYLASDPICWRWPVPSSLDDWTYPHGDDINDRLTDEALAMLMGNPEAKASAILTHWQDGRCAICGHREYLVEDHDHRTGMVRGYLCRGCNAQEGVHRSTDTLFGRYRERHPTSILGLAIRYWDPFTGDYAEPIPDRTQSRAENPWLKLARPQQQDD